MSEINKTLVRKQYNRRTKEISAVFQRVAERTKERYIEAFYKAKMASKPTKKLDLTLLTQLWEQTK